ncbi:MAG: tail fiber domain-containing protein [Saprospirales bacterium]|nr:tail fiber domain-containing protein [Saprospirales bacterium]
MKTLLVFPISFFYLSILWAQAPQKFNFQGIAHQVTGEVVPDQDISIRASILDGSPTGPSQYTEVHFVTTNQFGLFTTSIGGGAPLSGDFADITWDNGDKYLKIEIDLEGGNNYTLTGVSQLLSVPYSLYSQNTGQIQGNPVSSTLPDDEQVLQWDAGSGAWVPADEAIPIVYIPGPGIDINGSNQISNTAPDQVITISTTGATTISGSYPNFTINTPLPLDNSPTNELQTLSLAGSELYLSNGGGTVVLPPEQDGSITNELQTISQNGNTINLSNGGGSVTISSGTVYNAGAGIDITGEVISNTGDADSDPFNEIQTISLNGNTLSLSNGGGDVNFPLAPVYSGGPGISIDGSNQISNAGDLDPADDITNTTTAGGDLSGDYPDPSVVGIQGYPVSSMVPDSGQVLQWDGLSWAPGALTTTSEGWLLNGNSGSDSLTNFIGTTDNQPLIFKVNNTLAGKLSLAGENTFIGVNAGFSTSTGHGNAAFGFEPMYFNTEGSFNTAFGVQALYANTTGQGNTAEGYLALNANTEGEFNTAIGLQSLYSNTTGVHNTAVGADALYSNTEGEANTACGLQALYSNTTGLGNTACGYLALFNNTTGEINTAYGVEALFSNTEGSYNTAIGVGAMYSNTSGSDNVAIGEESLYFNTTGGANTAIGEYSLQLNTTGHENVANGFMAMVENVQGSYNSAIGTWALSSNESGNNNTTMGFQAMGFSSTASGNSVFGTNGLSNLATGSNNTAVGISTNCSSGAQTNSTVIGASAIVNANNKVRLGNTSTTVVEGQVAYSFPSDARFKFNVKEEVKGLDFIKRLRPVNYQFDTRRFEEFLMQNMPDSISRSHFEGIDFSESTGMVHTGFIAQEVQQAALESGYVFDGVHAPVDGNDNYSVAYSQFVVPLVKAVQEQQVMIGQLQQENASQKAEMAQLKAELQEIKALLMSGN